MFRFFFLIFILTTSLPGYSQDVTSILANNLPDSIKADSLDLMARKYMLRSKQDSTEILLNMAMEFALKSKNAAAIARCYVDYCSMYFLRGKFREAEKYLIMATPYVAVTNHYEVNLAWLMQRAGLFNVMDKKDSAIIYYYKTEQYNSQNNPYRNYVVYMALGELFGQMGDYAQADKYFIKAYNLTARKEGKPDHGYLLIVYINYLLSQNKPDGAGYLIAEYSQLMEERKKNHFQDPLQNLIMTVTSNRLENSIEFMKEVRQKSLADGENIQAIITTGYMVKYYERKQNYEEAIKFATEMEELAAKTASLSHLYQSRKLKFDLQQKAGKYMDASITAGSLFGLKDSMLTVQKREQVYELEAKYETEKKQNEIELLASRNALNDKTIDLLTTDKRLADLLLQQGILQNKSLERENILMDSIVKSEQAVSTAANNEKEKQLALNNALNRENRLKADQLMKERNTKWILAGGSVLLLLAGIAILFFYGKQKTKTSIIQKQSADLEILMKEIHHRVKNNLQVISSLLDLQSLTIADSQASEAVKEGKNRVQSMALIHQNLYSEGNIKGIKTKEYINNLLQSLCDSYNITNDKVKVSTQIDDLNLDIDTMIPLGLVLNELVSNSLKYAFKDGRKGELSILLKEEGQQLLLKVSDNGSGYPEGINVSEGKSFGMKMIKAFAKKLKAKLNIYNNDGAVVEMHITKYNLA